MNSRGRILSAFALLFMVATAAARDERSIADLSKALAALAPDVDPAEAQLLSLTAHTTARKLAREYRVVLNPEFTVFLVNVGLRKRGWCGHWTRDIGERLKELKLKTLVLHWGAYEPGRSGESNCVVVTAHNEPFQEGIVIDGWRRNGRLFWCKVPKDDEYKWKEDPQYTAWLQDYGHVYEWQSKTR
ncbi:MAG: hypothetical protein DME34_04705 [Verrucomicrobia bacterium]|nr:MAG: hypothetical protein DME34_04705 [Verrucomicrobiota bacterium]